MTRSCKRSWRKSNTPPRVCLRCTRVQHSTANRWQLRSGMRRRTPSWSPKWTGGWSTSSGSGHVAFLRWTYLADRWVIVSGE
eukprot:975114-Rhodomonas_salina.1